MIFTKICEVFGLQHLKLYQKDVFEAVLCGKDCFVCQPTGSGKSLAFQALPFLYYFQDHEQVSVVGAVEKCSRVVLVICPLVGLMKNQIEILKKEGIKAMCLRHDEDDSTSEKLEVSRAFTVLCLPHGPSWPVSGVS